MRLMRLAVLCALSALSVPTFAADATAQWGVQENVPFQIWGDDGLVLGATGSVQVAQNCSGPVPATNTFTEIGGGWYSLLMTSAELRAPRICLTITYDGGSATDHKLIVTYGCHRGAAQHSDGIVRCGFTQASSTTQVRLDAGASGSSTDYIHSLIAIVSGPGAGHTRRITAYNSSTKQASVDEPFPVAPSGSLYRIIQSYQQPILMQNGLVQSNAVAVGADTAAANNLRAAFNGTGGVTFSATIPWQSAWTNQVANAVWLRQCETDNIPAITCEQIMRLSLAHDWGRGRRLTSNSPWEVSTPDGNTLRTTTSYGSIEGNRITTIAP